MARRITFNIDTIADPTGINNLIKGFRQVRTAGGALERTLGELGKEAGDASKAIQDLTRTGLRIGQLDRGLDKTKDSMTELNAEATRLGRTITRISGMRTGAVLNPSDLDDATRGLTNYGKQLEKNRRTTETNLESTRRELQQEYALRGRLQQQLAAQVEYRNKLKRGTDDRARATADVEVYRRELRLLETQISSLEATEAALQKELKDTSTGFQLAERTLEGYQRTVEDTVRNTKELMAAAKSAATSLTAQSNAATRAGNSVDRLDRRMSAAMDLSARSMTSATQAQRELNEMIQRGTVNAGQESIMLNRVNEALNQMKSARQSFVGISQAIENTTASISDLRDKAVRTLRVLQDADAAGLGGPNITRQIADATRLVARYTSELDRLSGQSRESAAAFDRFGDEVEQFVNLRGEIAGSIQSTKQAMQEMQQRIDSLIRKIREFVDALGDRLVGALRAASSMVGRFGDSAASTFSRLQRSINGTITGFLGLGRAARTGFGDATNAMTQFLSAGWSLLGSGAIVQRLGTNIFRDIGRGLTEYMNYERSLTRTAISAAIGDEEQAAMFGGEVGPNPEIIQDLIFGLQRGTFGGAPVKAFNADELAQGLYFYASAIGQPIGTENMKIVGETVTNIMAMAAATQTSLETATKGVLNIAMEFGIDPRAAARVGTAGELAGDAQMLEMLTAIPGQLGYLANISTMEVPDIVEAFKMVGPMAHILTDRNAPGAGLEEMMALTFFASEVGLRGGNVGRGINQALTTLLDPSNPAIEAAANAFGIEASEEAFRAFFFDAEGHLEGGLPGLFKKMEGLAPEEAAPLLASLFTTNATRSVIGIEQAIRQSGGMEKILEGLTSGDPGEWLENAIETTNKTIFASFQNMKNMIFQAWAELVDAMRGPLTTLMDMIADVFMRIADIFDQNPVFAEFVGWAVTAAAAILTLVGTFLSLSGLILLLARAFGMLSAVAHPFFRLVVAIPAVLSAFAPLLLAVGAASYLLYQGWTNNFMGMQDSILRFKENFNFEEDVIPALFGAINGVRRFGVALGEALGVILLGRDDVATLADMLNSVFGPRAGMALVSSIMMLGDQLEGLRERVLSFLQSGNRVSQLFSNLGLAIQGFFEQVLLGQQRLSTVQAQDLVGQALGIDNLPFRLDQAANVISDFINAIVNAWMRLDAQLDPIFERTRENLDQIFGGDAFGTAMTVISNVLQGMVQGIERAVLSGAKAFEFLTRKIAQAGDSGGRLKRIADQLLGIETSVAGVSRALGVLIGTVLGVRLVMAITPGLSLLSRFAPALVTVAGGFATLSLRMGTLAAQTAFLTAAFAAQVAIMVVKAAIVAPLSAAMTAYGSIMLGTATAATVLSLGLNAIILTAGILIGVIGALGAAMLVAAFNAGGWQAVLEGIDQMFAGFISVVGPVIAAVAAFGEALFELIPGFDGVAASAENFRTVGIALGVVFLTLAGTALVAAIASLVSFGATMLSLLAPIGLVIAALAIFNEDIRAIFSGDLSGLSALPGVFITAAGAIYSMEPAFSALLGWIGKVNEATGGWVGTLATAAMLMPGGPAIVGRLAMGLGRFAVAHPLLTVGAIATTAAVSAYLASGPDESTNMVQWQQAVEQGGAAFSGQVDPATGIPAMTSAGYIDAAYRYAQASQGAPLPSGWEEEVPDPFEADVVAAYNRAVRHWFEESMPTATDIELPEGEMVGVTDKVIDFIKTNAQKLTDTLGINLGDMFGPNGEFDFQEIFSAFMGITTGTPVAFEDIDPTQFMTEEMADAYRLQEAWNEWMRYVDEFGVGLASEIYAKHGWDIPENPVAIEQMNAAMEAEAAWWEAYNAKKTELQSALVQAPLETLLRGYFGADESAGQYSLAETLGQVAGQVVQNAQQAGAPEWFTETEFLIDAALSGINLTQNMAGVNIQKALEPVIARISQQTGVPVEQLSAGLPTYQYDQQLMPLAQAELMRIVSERPDQAALLDTLGADIGMAFNWDELLAYGVSMGATGQPWTLVDFLADQWDWTVQQVSDYLMAHGIDPATISSGAWSEGAQAAFMGEGAGVLSEETWKFIQTRLESETDKIIEVTRSEFNELDQATRAALIASGYTFVVSADTFANAIAEGEQGIVEALHHMAQNISSMEDTYGLDRYRDEILQGDYQELANGWIQITDSITGETITVPGLILDEYLASLEEYDRLVQELKRLRAEERLAVLVANLIPPAGISYPGSVGGPSFGGPAYISPGYVAGDASGGPVYTPPTPPPAPAWSIPGMGWGGGMVGQTPLPSPTTSGAWSPWGTGGTSAPTTELKLENEEYNAGLDLSFGKLSGFTSGGVAGAGNGNFTTTLTLDTTAYDSALDMSWTKLSGFTSGGAHGAGSGSFTTTLMLDNTAYNAALDVSYYKLLGFANTAAPTPYITMLTLDNGAYNSALDVSFGKLAGFASVAGTEYKTILAADPTDFDTDLTSATTDGALFALEKFEAELHADSSQFNSVLLSATLAGILFSITTYTTNLNANNIGFKTVYDGIIAALTWFDNAVTTTSLSADAAAFWNVVNSIPLYVATRYVRIEGVQQASMFVGGGATSSGPLQAYAKGGFVKSPWALVGEEGPEIVRFPYGSFVYDTSETTNILSRLSKQGVYGQPTMVEGNMYRSKDVNTIKGNTGTTIHVHIDNLYVQADQTPESAIMQRVDRATGHKNELARRGMTTFIGNRIN